MPDLDDRAGRCSPVTLSNEKAPSPIQARSHPHPPGSSRLEAFYDRRTANCRARSQLAWPASTTTTPRPASFVHADQTWE